MLISPVVPKSSPFPLKCCRTDMTPNMRAAILSTPWTPFKLGAKLLLFMDAEADSSLVMSSTLVNSWDTRAGVGMFSQSTTGFKPTRLPATLNGRPGIVFDGSDDYLGQTGIGSLPFGNDTLDLDIIALERNATPPGTATSNNIISWGNTTGSVIQMQRSANGGVARRQLSVGNGATQTQVIISGAPNNSKCLTHGRVYPGGASIRIQNEAEVTGAVNHVVANDGASIGSSRAGTVLFWNGAINFIIVASGLTANEREQLRNWGNARGSIW